MPAVVQCAPDPRRPGRVAYLIQGADREQVQNALDGLMLGADASGLICANAEGPHPTEDGGFVAAVRLERQPVTTAWSA